MIHTEISFLKKKCYFPVTWLYFLTVTEFCVTNDLGYSFHSQVLSSFMTYHRRLVTRVTRWVPLVEHELLTLPEHLFFSVGFMLLDLLFYV